ncbi:hypothetical protein MMC11_005278 [Xylographa trunciseda]|nr:hypothetical protein [Xylographa trunciseda]
MSAAPVYNILVSMDFDSSQCSGMTAGQPPSRSVTSIRYIDWILIPDICDADSVASDPGIDIIPINSVEIICPSPRRQCRPWPRFREELGLFYKDQDPRSVELIKDHRPASTEVPEQTPPSRPSPRRLPTPDLLDLDQEEFWPGAKHLEKCHGSINGFDLKHSKQMKSLWSKSSESSLKQKG